MIEIQLTREGGSLNRCLFLFKEMCWSLIYDMHIINVEVFPVFTSKPEFPSSQKDLLSRFGPMVTRIHFPCVLADGSHSFSLRSLEHKGACPGLATSSTPSRQTSLPLEHITVCLHPPSLILPQSTQASLGWVITPLGRE